MEEKMANVQQHFTTVNKESILDVLIFSETCICEKKKSRKDNLDFKFSTSSFHYGPFESSAPNQCWC